MGGLMSIAGARLRAACASAVIAALVPGPGGTPARALDAPVTVKNGPAPTPPTTRKPAKVISGKPPVPPPPTKPGLPHPAGWPAAPIGDGPANHRDASLPPNATEKANNSKLQDTAPESVDAPPEAEEQNFFQRMIRARTRTIETEPNDPKRRDLAEPPDGYRRPTQDTDRAVETEASKSPGIFGTIGALWNGGGPTGKPAEEQGATSAPKPATDASETGGLLGKIGGMLPGFLRGSDKK